jgi:hypothetical protein
MGEKIKPTCQWVNCYERAARSVTFSVRIFDVDIWAGASSKVRTRRLCSTHVQEIRDTFVNVSVSALKGASEIIKKQDRKNRRYKFYLSQRQMLEQEAIDRQSRLNKLPVMRALLDDGEIVDYSEATHPDEPNGHSVKWQDSIFLGEGIPIRTARTNTSKPADPKDLPDITRHEQ